MFSAEILASLGEVLISWIMSDRALTDEEDPLLLPSFGGFESEGYSVCLWSMDCFVGSVRPSWKTSHGGLPEEEVEDPFLLESFSGFPNEVSSILGWSVNSFLGSTSMSLDIRLSPAPLLDASWLADDSFSDFLSRSSRTVCLAWTCGICSTVAGLVRELASDVCLKIEALSSFSVDLAAHDFCEHVDCDSTTPLPSVLFWFPLLICRSFSKQGLTLSPESCDVFCCSLLILSSETWEPFLWLSGFLDDAACCSLCSLCSDAVELL